VQPTYPDWQKVKIDDDISIKDWLDDVFDKLTKQQQQIQPTNPHFAKENWRKK